MTLDGLAGLRRHQLAFLVDAAWTRLLQQDWPPIDRACLERWAAKKLPLVVTRQPSLTNFTNLTDLTDLTDLGVDQVTLGLPAPTEFQRRRLSLQVADKEILYIDEFPKMVAIEQQFDSDFASRWNALARQLEALACYARVYGSRGWQVQTNQLYVHSSSDIDLMIPVSSPLNADEVCQLLAAFHSPKAKLDGELVFKDGSAVAWREWQRWREGKTRELLVKQLNDVMLVSDLQWLAPGLALPLPAPC